MKSNLKKTFSTSIIYTIFLFVLHGCGAGTTNPTPAYTNQTLSNLQFDGYNIDFSPSKTGIYQIETPNSQTSIRGQFLVDKTDYKVTYTLQNIAGVQTEDLESNEVEVNLEEGANLLSINITDANTDVSVSYTTYIYRLSSAARISHLSLYNFIGASDIHLSPTFDETTYNYNATVGYTTCSYAYTAHKKNGGSTLSTRSGEAADGDTYDNIEERKVYYRNLLPGSNHLDINVTSEDFTTSERYSVTIHRDLPTQNELEGNANLSNIKMDNNEFSFTCGISDYTFFIDSNIDTITYQLTPEVEGSTIYINNEEINPTETQRILAIADTGTTNIDVISSDETNSQRYTLNYIRLPYNSVFVDSIAELKSALQNAQPNDQIIIASGRYELDAETTGLLHSDRSGTSLTPIYLTGETSLTDDVVFTGLNPGADTLLTIAGQHWNISNIIFEGGKTGVHLNGAKNIQLRNLVFSQFSEQSILMNNGAESNTVSLTEFNSYFLSTLESASNNVATAIRIGDMLTRGTNAATTSNQNSNNTIRHNTFTNLGDATAIDVDSNSFHTQIHSNRFTEHSQPLASTSRSNLIRNLGDSSSFNYNKIEYSDPRTLDAIFVNGASTIHSSWANNTHLLQNHFDLTHDSLSAIHNDSSHLLFSTDNISVNSNDLIISGGNADFTQYSAPTFTIQTTGNNQRCLGYETYSINSVDYKAIELQMCNQDDPTQQWKPEVDDGIYVGLINLGADTEYLRTTAEFEGLCSITEGIYQSNVYLAEDTEGYVQRWMLDTSDNITVLRNKKDIGYSLTIPNSIFSPGTPLMTCAHTNSPAQHFTLVPMEPR